MRPTAAWAMPPMNPATGSASNVELQRLAGAEDSLPQFFPGVVRDGTLLWAEEARPGQLDDRRLYWQRLAVLQDLSDEDKPAFEAASRGLSSFGYSDAADLKIAVTGFDPFHLEDHIDQGNPSGLVALQLHGRKLQLGNCAAEIQSIVVPVRYRDFDEGLIENFFAPILGDLDMVITVSMGRDGFDLERFPGRRRSVTTPDNENIQAGGSPAAPIVPLVPDGPEFVEFSLPVDVMCAVKGDFSVTDNRVVTTLEDGEVSAGGIEDLQGKTAVFGSGGGYLSNEISYRVLRLAQASGVSIPIGHIHTPRMQGFNPGFLKRVTSQCHQLIVAAAETLAV